MGANSLCRAKGYFGEFFRRMRAKLGTAQAITATAHKIARILYHVLLTKEPYAETVFHRCDQQAQPASRNAPPQTGSSARLPTPTHPGNRTMTISSSGAGLEVASGRGVTYVKYELSRTYVGAVADVEVNRKSGDIHVKRFAVVQDCGQVINPDGVRNQIEGNVIQTVSRTLKEEVTFDRSRVTSLDWASYPILTALKSRTWTSI